MYVFKSLILALDMNSGFWRTM